MNILIGVDILEKEQVYYQGAIYLKKTVDDIITENLDPVDFLQELSNSTNYNSRNEDYEKFYILNVEKDNSLTMVSSTKYKYKTQMVKLSRPEELNKKYTYLLDFIKKAQYIGKEWSIIDQNTDYVQKRSGIAYYKYNDRLLVERRNLISGKTEIEITRKKATEDFSFKGLVNEKYLSIKEIFTTISRQIATDFYDLNNEIDKGKIK